MSTEFLLETLQQIAENTYLGSVPSDYLLGVVVSSSPLQIRIEQGEIVSEEFLVLTDAVRDYEVDIEISYVSETRAGGSGYAEYQSHNHDCKGRKKIIVYNALKTGESVIMIKQAGGQQYCVLSRLNNHINLTGEWRD